MFVVCNINVATAAVAAIGPLLKQNFYPQNVHKLCRNISTWRLAILEFKLLKRFLIYALLLSRYSFLYRLFRYAFPWLRNYIFMFKYRI